MQEFFFNPSLWMPVAGFVVAIVVFVYGNNRLRPPIRNAGLGLVGVVIAWCVAAYFVETRVEQCIARTNAIVAAVEAADWPRLTSLLDKTTSLATLHGPDAIVTNVQMAASRYGLKDIRILNTTAVEGVGGTCDLTFRALVEGIGTLPATFRFEYEQRSDGILLSKIEPVTIGNVSEDEVRREIR